MNNIGLTSREIRLIEDILVSHGLTVTFEQIVALMPGESRQHLRNRVSRLAKKGWLLRIKKGLYAVCDIISRGSVPFSVFAIPNLLVLESYISFEGALQHHGLYDQLLGSLRSVSLKQYKEDQIGSMAYQFIKTKATYFYGWEVIWFGNLDAKIATPEKALIDLVQFHRNTYTVDLVIAVLAKYEESVDIQRLAGYLESAPVTVQRIFGFIFELVGLRSQAEVLEALVGERASRSKMTSESALFNARWRLYYDDYFWKYTNTLHNI